MRGPVSWLMQAARKVFAEMFAEAHRVTSASQGRAGRHGEGEREKMPDEGKWRADSQLDAINAHALQAALSVGIALTRLRG